MASNQFGPGSSRTLPIDDMSGALETIEFEHHELHDGDAFACHLAGTALNTGDILQLLIVTPDSDHWAHMTFMATATGEGYISIYEGVVTSANGTAVAVYNRNRNSATAATLTAYHTPTVTNVGTEIRGDYVGAGKSSGGDFRARAEWVLKKNVKYLFRLTAGVNGMKAILRPTWYEHTGVAG